MPDGLRKIEHLSRRLEPDTIMRIEISARPVDTSTLGEQPMPDALALGSGGRGDRRHVAGGDP